MGSIDLASSDRHDLVAKLAASTEGVLVKCASASMEPTIRVGDVVRVHRASSIRTGDVVVFETADGSALMLHRVVLAIAKLPWVAHLGDASAARATGVFHRSRLIGVADSSRARPRRAAVAVAMLRLARRAVSDSFGRALRR